MKKYGFLEKMSNFKKRHPVAHIYTPHVRYAPFYGAYKLVSGHCYMTTDKDKYQDLDELQLYLTIIEKATVSFSPVRTIEFNVIKPFDHSEKVLRYNKGTLTFTNVLYSDIELINEFYEYPEFHRSAILTDSKLLRATNAKLDKVSRTSSKIYKDYYLYIDHGNKASTVHIICENHHLTVDTDPKPLTEFSGLDE